MAVETSASDPAMGFGSPPPGEHMKTIRAILFFVAMLALWTAVQALFFALSGGGAALAVLLGIIFGYPSTTIIALLEFLSSKITTGARARVLFLLLVAGVYLAIWHFFTSSAPSRGISNRAIVLITIPGSIAIILGYFMRGLWRDAVAEQARSAQ
jgi:hypothetical protein